MGIIFVCCKKKLLGNTKAENCKHLVETSFENFHFSEGSTMGIKINFFISHLEFPANLGDICDEHGKHIHQDIKVMEKYQG